MVLPPGGRRGACALLFRVWPPRLRSHSRLAAVGAVECRVFAAGPGATRRAGPGAAGDPGAAPVDPTAASPNGKLGAPALLCRPERGVRQGTRAAAPAHRRPAVVRSRLVRMAAFAIARRLHLTDSGSRHGAVRRDRPHPPARGPVERPAPNRTGCGTPALAADRRRDRGTRRLRWPTARSIRPIRAPFTARRRAIRFSSWRACAPDCAIRMRK